MRIFMITVVALALAAPAFAGIYKWKDKNGKIHFTDSLNKVPLEHRNKKRIRKMESIKADSSNPPSSAPAAPKHLGVKQEGSHSQGDVDKQRVNDLLRLNQKKHYDHQ